MELSENTNDVLMNEDLSKRADAHAHEVYHQMTGSERAEYVGLFLQILIDLTEKERIKAEQNAERLKAVIGKFQ